MKYLLPIFLAFTMTACTSTGNGDNGGPDIPDYEYDPGFNNPNIDKENPIEDEKGYSVIDDVIYLDGVKIGEIQTDMFGKLSVVDNDGNTIAQIEQTMGGYRIIIEDTGSKSYKDSYHIVKDDQGNWSVDWANSVIDNDWGHSVDDIEGVPELYSGLNKSQIKQKAQTLRHKLKGKIKRNR